MHKLLVTLVIVLFPSSAANPRKRPAQKCCAELASARKVLTACTRELNDAKPNSELLATWAHIVAERRISSGSPVRAGTSEQLKRVADRFIGNR